MSSVICHLNFVLRLSFGGVSRQGKQASIRPSLVHSRQGPDCSITGVCMQNFSSLASKLSEEIEVKGCVHPSAHMLVLVVL